MSEHPNVVLARRLYEAFATKDLDTILALTHPDIVMSQTSELPWGGRYEGHTGLGEFYAGLLGTIESTVTTQELFAAGDDVVQIGRTAGTVLGTGVAFDVVESHVLTFTDGLVTTYESRIDTPAMLEALDAPG